MNKYIFSNSYSGRLARERLMKIKFWSMFNWRMISHAFMVALATIGVMLLAWVGVVAVLLAYGNYYR